MVLLPAFPAFVSHAHEDGPWSRDFVRELKRLGMCVWYDEFSVRYGRLPSQIDRELACRPVFIGVMSPAAVSSSWVHDEVEAAIQYEREQKERIVLFVYAEECQIPRRWAEFVSERGANSAALSPSQAARQIVRSLSHWFMPIAPDSVREIRRTADRFRSEGRLDRAVQVYVEALYQARQDARGAGTKYDALRDLRRFESQDPADAARLNLHSTMRVDSPAAWNREADALRHQGSLEEAVAFYTKALDLDAYSTRAWIGVGIAYEGLGEYVDALTAFDFGLQLDPTSSRGWEARGRVYQALGNPVGALESYDRALDVLSQPFQDWEGTGWAHGWTGRAAKQRQRMLAIVHAWRERCDGWAIAKARRESQVDAARPPAPSASASVLVERGATLLETGHQREAARVYAEALLIKNDSAVAWFLRALTLGDLGRHWEAAEAYARVVALDKLFVDAWIGLGDSLYHQRSFWEAADAFGQALSLRPNDAIALRSKGSALRDSGMYAEALDAYERALALYPEGAEIWSSKGTALALIGQFDDALGAYERALQLNPTLRSALQRRQDLLSWRQMAG